MNKQQRAFIEQRMMLDAAKGGTAFALLIFAGVFGAHRFYLGRPWSAVLLAICFIWGAVFAALLSPVIGLGMMFAGCFWLLVDLVRIRGLVRATNRKRREQITRDVLAEGW